MKIWNTIKKECGAVEVVEAAFVFPIVIFVVILLIMYGNMLYQQSKVDAIAVRGAEYLASLYTNPLLQQSALPTDTTKVKTKPYRYLFGDGDAETAAKKFINAELKKVGTGFFSGMGIQPKVSTCEIKNYIVYQTAHVQIDFSIQLVPLRLFGGNSLLRSSNATVMAATDSAEFIRNVDMIMDYAEEFHLTDKIQTAVGAFTGD